MTVSPRRDGQSLYEGKCFRRLQQTTRARSDAQTAQARHLIESEALIVGRRQNPHGAQDCPCIEWVWTPVGLRWPRFWLEEKQ